MVVKLPFRDMCQLYNRLNPFHFDLHSLPSDTVAIKIIRVPVYSKDLGGIQEPRPSNNLIDGGNASYRLPKSDKWQRDPISRHLTYYFPCSLRLGFNHDEHR